MLVVSMQSNDTQKSGRGVTRRQFIQTSTVLAGAAMFSPWALADSPSATRTGNPQPPQHQVTLG